MELKSIIYLLVVFSGVSLAFDFFEGNSQIPSDGFHDLLGLTPFWLQQPVHDDLRRTLGTKRDNLPSFRDFKSQNSGSSTYQMAGKCSLKGTFTSSKAKLQVQKLDGCTKPSLTEIFHRFFPAIDLDRASGNRILSDDFYFDELEVAKGSQDVTVKATAKGVLDFVERELLLTEGRLRLQFPATATTFGGITQWRVVIEGDIMVSTHAMRMTIDKPKEEENFPFTWQIRMVGMVDLMGLFGITSSAMNFNDVGIDGSIIDGVTFTDATIKGQINADNSFQIVAKSSVAMSQASQQADWWLILTRPVGQVVKAAIIIDVKDTINIKDALEIFITQKDFISDFGMIGRIERDCVIMLAKEDIVMVDNDDFDALVSKFLTPHDTKQIPKGVNVRVLVPVKDNMEQSCSASAKLPVDLPEILPFTIKITAGGLSFSYPDKFASDLPSMLKCLDKQIAAELPSQLFPKPEGLINIKEFTVAYGQYMKLTVTLQGPFHFLGGKLNLSDIDVSVSKKAGQNESWQFSGSTTVTVGKLAVAVGLDKDGGNYKFSAYVESFKLNQLEEMIGETSLTQFVGLLGNLSDFGIKDFKLVREFGETSSLRVSGVPILWGWDKCTIEGLVWKPDKSKPKNREQPDTAVAVGVVVEAVRLDKLMEKILGNNFFSVAWFSEMTALVIVSNADAKVEAPEDAKPNKINSERGTPRSTRRLVAQPENKRNTIPENAPREQNGKRASILKVFKRQTSSEEEQSYIQPKYVQRAAQKARKSNPVPHVQSRVAPRISVAKRAGNRNSNNNNNRNSNNNNRHSSSSNSNRNNADNDNEAADSSDDDDDDDDEGAIKFNIPYLTSQDIQEGVTFIGMFNIPQDNGCKGDSLCLWLAEKVGRDATIEIMGAIMSDGFRFAASFSGTIPVIPDKLSLQGVSLELTLSGMKSSVKLSCKLYWSDPAILHGDHIIFEGAIEVSLTGKLSLEFNMMGIWTQPFGCEYLAFGNVHLAVGISVGAPIPSFEFGAEIWVGKIKPGVNNNEHAIKIAGYFGVDINNPTDNYVYASINAFTIAKVYEAFELGEPNLPRFIADTGFPEGITVAYSAKGKHIEAHDINIEAGLYLKATINFLGFNLSSEIIFNDDRLMIDVSMSPIDWAGGLIQVRRSDSDRKNGPKAFINLVKGDSITVQINGYVSLLGISREIYIDISDTGIKFNMTTRVWNMIEASLEVNAAYGSWASLSFSFVARVIIHLHLDEIADAIRSVLKNAEDAANKAIEAAHGKLDEARSALSHADEKMAGWQSDMSAYQNKLRARSAEIERQKNQMVANCKSQCGQVCVPFFGWKDRCFKIWWWWVGCLTWDHCKWKVDNIICIAGCEIAKVGKKFVAWAEQAGISLLIGLTEVGKGLLDVGRGVVGLANKLVDFAGEVLEFAKKAVAVGLQIVQATIDWLAKNLFDIRKIELGGSLDKEFNACLDLIVDCTILGLNIDYEGRICINLNFWKYLGTEVAEKTYPGIKEQDQEVQKLEGKFEEFDKDKEDLEKEEQNVENDVRRETSQRRKRDYVPTAEEAYYRRLAVEPLPAVVTRGAETVEAFKTSAPWVLAQDFDIRDFDHTPHVDDSIPAEKRTLHEDWEKHTPCVQIHKVIDKYSMIADGLSTLSESLRDVRGNYQATKRSMEIGVDALEGQVNDIENKHNMTLEERSDLHHWYDEAKDGLKKWEEKASTIVDEHHELAIPTFRSQINHILNKEKKTNFVGYMNELHEVGEAAYKRSNIPNANMIAAAQELQGIKRDLISIVHDDDANAMKLKSGVRSVQSNIQGLRRSMQRCQ